MTVAIFVPAPRILPTSLHLCSGPQANGDGEDLVEPDKTSMNHSDLRLLPVSDAMKLPHYPKSPESLVWSLIENCSKKKKKLTMMKEA